MNSTQFLNRTKRLLRPTVLSGLLGTLILSAFIVLGQNSSASDRNMPITPVFDFKCETSEAEFFDWIETELISVRQNSKQKKLRRSLAGAIDALVSNPDWKIRLTTQSCSSDAISKSRREALFFMIDDAHTEGAGQIEQTDLI